MRWTWALIATGIACTSEDPPGQLMLAVTSDLLPADDIDRLIIEMKRPEGSILKRESFDLGPPTGSTLPATLGITAATAPDSPLVIRVHAYSNTDEVYVLREVVTSIPADRIALVRTPLEFLCFGSGYYILEQDYVEAQCLNETTCKGGVCEPPEIIQPALPTYDEALLFGGCFDTLDCFAGDRGAVSVVAPPTGANPCTVPIPNAMQVANVALVTDGRHGTCYGGGACLVPLDPELPSGWSADATTITLPPGVCNPPPWFVGTVTRVALTPACERKTPELAVCGKGSAVGPGAASSLPPPMEIP